MLLLTPEMADGLYCNEFAWCQTMGNQLEALKGGLGAWLYSDEFRTSSGG
jgi:hypothetical protein